MIEWLNDWLRTSLIESEDESGRSELLWCGDLDSAQPNLKVKSRGGVVNLALLWFTFIFVYFPIFTYFILMCTLGAFENMLNIN
jgi:hypothetical protein